MPPVDRSRGYNRILRKALHISGGAFAFLLPLTPPWVFLAGAVAGTLVGYLVKPRMNPLLRQLSKPADRNRGALTGVRAYFGALILLGLLWLLLDALDWRSPWAYVQFGWLSMALGDGLAGLVGPRPGRTRTVPWNRHKTWWGVVGCLAGVAIAWLTSLAPLCQSAGVGVGLHVVVAAGACTAVALIESVRLKLDDNIMVGLGAALLAILMALALGLS